MIHLIGLAWRNFVRHLSRYRVLLVALITVVAALIVILGTVSGMRETLRGKASRYFSGNVVVFGYTGQGGSQIDDPARVDRLIDQAGLNELARSHRSVYLRDTEANLFHAGNFTRQRRFVGVEWDRERPVLERFDFESGGVPESGDRRGALISTAAAEALQARVGDAIIVSTLTDRGQTNTVEVIVRGIYREATFFGYITYIQRETLNELLGRPADRVDEIGVYLAPGSVNEMTAARRITRELARELPTFPVLTDRDMNSEQRAMNRDVRHYGVITLAAQLAEVNDLLQALTIIAGTIVLAFLVLFTIGVSNTYAMIVYERTREIGTLRAMGMQKTRTVSTFLFEATFLSVVGSIVGIALGLSLLFFVGTFVVFTRSPGFADLFLVGGRLDWYVSFAILLLVLSLSVVATLSGCLRSVFRAGNVSPVDALRQ